MRRQDRHSHPQGEETFLTLLCYLLPSLTFQAVVQTYVHQNQLGNPVICKFSGATFKYLISWMIQMEPQNLHFNMQLIFLMRWPMKRILSVFLLNDNSSQRLPVIPEFNQCLIYLKVHPYLPDLTCIFIIY